MVSFNNLMNLRIIEFIKKGNFKLEMLNCSIFPLAIIYGLVIAGISVLTINVFEVDLINGLILGFVAGFFNLILAKIIFMIWNQYRSDNIKRQGVNWRSYFIFGLITGLLNILLLYIIFMINDSLLSGGFPKFMKDPVFRSISLPIMIVIIFKIILVDLVRWKWFLKILVIFDIVRIVEFYLPRKRIITFPDNKSNDDNREIIFLRRIDLASNNLVNSVELNAFLGQCKSLIYLNLSHNDLDEVPSGIDQLTNIQELKLEFNKIDKVKHNYLFKLVTLNLSTNNLIIDQNNNFYLGSYTNLEKLNLSNNTILKLPTSQLESLNVINLSNTGMDSRHKDNLKEFFQQCKGIKNVNLSNNNLEHFPEPLKDYGLIKLNLSNTRIRKLLGDLKFRRTLTHLDLSKNSLKQDHPPQNARSIVQEEIDSSITNLVGSQEIIRVFPALEELDLSNNGLTKLPSNLEHLVNLKSFLFANNLIQEDIGQKPNNITNLTKLTKLETLDLSGNDSLAKYLIEGEEKGFFSNFDELSSIFLRNIGLEEFPASLINLTKLNLLDLEKNKINLREFETSTWEFLSQIQILNFKANPLEYDELDQIWVTINPKDTGYQNYLKYQSANIFPRELSKKFIVSKKVKIDSMEKIKEIFILFFIITYLLLVLYSAQIIFDNIFEFVIGISAVLTILFYRQAIRYSGNPDDWRFLNDIIFNILLLFIVIFLIPPSLRDLPHIIGFGLLIMVYDILLESFGYHGNRWKPKGGFILPYLKIPWEMVLSFFIIGAAGYFLLSIPEIIGITDTLGAFLFRLIIAVGGIFWGTSMDWGSPRTTWQPINKWNVWNTRGIWAYGGFFGLALYYWANPIITTPKSVCLGSIPCFATDHMIISILLVIIFIIMGIIRYHGLDDRGNWIKMAISVIIPPIIFVIVYFSGYGVQDIFFPWIIGIYIIIQSLFVLVILINNKKYLLESKTVFKLSLSVVIPLGIFLFGAWLLTS